MNQTETHIYRKISQVPKRKSENKRKIFNSKCKMFDMEMPRETKNVTGKSLFQYSEN